MRSNSIPAPVLTAKVLHLHSSPLCLCLDSFGSSETNLFPLICLLAWDASPLWSGCCLCFICPSIHPFLTPRSASLLPVPPSSESTLFFSFDHFWLIKLVEEGSQAVCSGLATLQCVHWLGLMLFSPHICRPGPMKRHGHVTLYGSHNKGPSFITQQSSAQRHSLVSLVFRSLRIIIFPSGGTWNHLHSVLKKMFQSAVSRFILLACSEAAFFSLYCFIIVDECVHVAHTIDTHNGWASVGSGIDLLAYS